MQLNLRLVIPKEANSDKKCIHFLPNDFTFSFNERIVTVQQYFRERHNVELRFPQMPLILI